MRRLTKAQLSTLEDVLRANGLGSCDHPDCDPRQPSCAVNYIHLRARDAVQAAFRLGLGEVVVEKE